MGIFNNNDDGSKHNHTCPSENAPSDPVQIPVINGYSFHDLSMIISGSCMAFACLVSFYMIMRHATHFSLPKEQKQIMRIIFMVPVFSVITFLSVTYYDAAIYIKPVENFYEAIALASFFLLLCEFIQENEDERHTFLTSSGAIKQHTFATIGAFQFPVVMLGALIATDITEANGSYCVTSNKPYFAKIWVTIVNMISTSTAILSVIKFYSATKTVTKPRKPLSKLIAFKAIVGLGFLQDTIFAFLKSGNDLKPTKHYTFKDLSIGVPNLILSIEMVIFSLAFLYVFRASAYHPQSGASAVPLGHGGYQGGTLGIKAIAKTLNPIDIITGILSIPAALFNKNDTAVPPNKKWASGSGSEYESINLHSQYSNAPEYPPASHEPRMSYPQGAGYTQSAGYTQGNGYHAATPFNPDSRYHH